MDIYAIMEIVYTQEEVRMRKFMITVFTVIISIMILAAAVGGFFLYRRYSPSKSPADQNEWFGVIGNDVAVILDNELDGNVRGKFSNEQVYLPLNWVNENLNERFYWDEENRQLIYALPDSIVYADGETMGNDGYPLLFEADGEVWLKTGLIAAYTDVQMDIYTDGDAKRIFVDTARDEIPVAEVKKEGRVRVLGGIKSGILTEVQPEQEVEVLETMEKWSKVRTQDGFIGYVQNKLLGEREMRSHISTFQAPVYTNISMDEPVCLVWHQVTSMEANNKMEQLMADTKGVNVIAPTWFMLTDNEGNYHSLADITYVNKAHNMGLQVWATLDNFNKGDEVNSEILFASTDARRKLIASLMADVERYNLDGINLDIESIRPEAGPHYIQFIRELSVHCRKNGVILSVDSYVPSAYTAFYNRAEQGRVADYVIIMGYDEHYAGGEAGSVASLGYERQGIEDTLKQVPAEKVISAIPFYTRLWKEEGDSVTSTAMGIAAARKWVEENNMELYWQEELGQYYGELKSGGANYLLWMEEEKSIGKKMELVDQYKLAGVACWKLGFEPADIWDIIQR